MTCVRTDIRTYVHEGLCGHMTPWMENGHAVKCSVCTMKYTQDPSVLCVGLYVYYGLCKHSEGCTYVYTPGAFKSSANCCVGIACGHFKIDSMCSVAMVTGVPIASFMLVMRAHHCRTAVLAHLLV